MLQGNNYITTRQTRDHPIDPHLVGQLSPALTLCCRPAPFPHPVVCPASVVPSLNRRQVKDARLEALEADNYTEDQARFLFSGRISWLRDSSSQFRIRIAEVVTCFVQFFVKYSAVVQVLKPFQNALSFFSLSFVLLFFL